MRCVSRVPSHSGATPGVSTEPISVCGSAKELFCSARYVKRKCQEFKKNYGSYEYDFGILAETEDELQRRVVERQEASEKKGLKVNAYKTEIMVSLR